MLLYPLYRLSCHVPASYGYSHHLRRLFPESYKIRTVKHVRGDITGELLANQRRAAGLLLYKSPRLRR